MGGTEELKNARGFILASLFLPCILKIYITKTFETEIVQIFSKIYNSNFNCEAALIFFYFYFSFPNGKPKNTNSVVKCQ